MRGHPPNVRTLSRGFTIVELLIVIVVIAILAAITIVAYNGIQNRAKDSASLSNAQQTGKKLTVYALSNGEALPADLATAGITNSGDITYQYTRNTTTNPNTFCLTTTSGGTSAHIAGSTSSIKNAVAGPCPGHTGTAPTTLAGGGTCPDGYIVVPGSSLYDTEAFCVMKYEAKNVSSVATSQSSGTPWVSISQTASISTAAAACDGCHLITENEWLTIAQNTMSVGSNWLAGTVGNSTGMYRGHTDNAPSSSLAASTDNDGYSGTGQTTGEQRRTLTLNNGEVIWDFAGNVWEWTSGTTEGAGNQPGAAGYGWRNWNSLASAGNLSPNPFPSYANPDANAWTSTQNIGQIYSSSTEGGLRAFLRGGYWNNGSYAGVFALLLNNSPSSTYSDIGFRVAR